MSKDTNPEGFSSSNTKGDYSPGIVMGNYTVNAALTPTAVSLEEAFKISLAFEPSKRGRFVDFDSTRKVFVNGCRFDLRIGNGGLSDLILTELRLRVEFEHFPHLALPDKTRKYLGAFIPHQLFIDIYQDAAPGWWLLSQGTKHSPPRKFVDARKDILESGPGPRLQFKLTPGELETIEGGLTPREEGLFRIHFVFVVVTASERLCRTTEGIFIMKGNLIKERKGDNDGG